MMESAKAWSVFRRAQIDDIVQEGRGDTLRGTIKSHLQTINIQYTLNSRLKEFCEYELRDVWYTLIQAGKNITTHQLSKDGVIYESRQDTLIRDLVTFRALGTLQRSVQSSGQDDDSKGPDIITFSDGYTLWSGLPLLSTCLIDEFTERYYQKDYSMEQRENMAGLLGRLLAAGFYDGPALCAVSLFQKTLETPRLLVTDPETPEMPSSLEGLLDALGNLCQNSGYGLAILSSSLTPAASLTKTNAADHPYLSDLGELALQAGATAPHLTGYSPERWKFWVQRLGELRQCGIENIELGAKSCLSSMYQAGEQTNLLPGLIDQELIITEI